MTICIFLLMLSFYYFQNPRELTAGVDQNILDYSVSFNDGQTRSTNCSNTNCLLYVQPPPSSLSTVSVAARNVIGRGEERSYSVSSSANSESSVSICIIENLQLSY